MPALLALPPSPPPPPDYPGKPIPRPALQDASPARVIGVVVRGNTRVRVSGPSVLHVMADLFPFWRGA